MHAVLRVRTAPEDILQEAYLDVARSIDRFENRGPGSFYSWVQSILSHKLADACRAAHCQARDIQREAPSVGVGAWPDQSYCNLLDRLSSDSGTPSRVVRRREAITAVAESLTRLSEAHRQVIQLRFLDELPLSEVAARLGKTDAAVAALTQRALQSLRGVLADRGEVSWG